MSKHKKRKQQEEQTIYTGSIFGANTQKPLVELAIGDAPGIQMDVATARLVAMRLLAAAEAAETDAILWKMAEELIGLEGDHRAAFLLTARQIRDELRAETMPDPKEPI